VLPAKVLQVRDGKARVEAVGAVLDASMPVSVEPGTEVRLVVRPEAIEVAPANALATHWQATVAERVFLGEKIEYRMQLAAESLMVVRYNAGVGDLIEPGSKVGLRVVDGTASIIPKEGA